MHGDDGDAGEEAQPEGDTDEPAEHRCPEHPDTEALGACSRCGSYYCEACLRQADRPSDSARCGKCPLETPEARPLGGWLWLPGLQLFFNALIAVRVIIDDIEALATPDGTPGLLPFLTTDILVRLGFLALTIAAGLHFFRKMKRAVPLMLGVYTAVVAITLFDLGAAAYLEEVLGTPQPIDGPQAVRGLIGPAIWIAYFTNSKRVRETFVLE